MSGIEVVVPDAGAERGDQGADFLARQHLVEARPLDIEDFSAQRKHRLIFPVAALLGGAAGRIALDEKEFGLRRIAFLAIGEFARQIGDIERAFAAGELARLARRFACLRRFDHLADDGPRVLRMLLEPCAKHLVDEAFDRRPHLGGHKLFLGLRGKFWVGNLHRKHAGETLAAIVSVEIDLLALGKTSTLRIARDLAGQRGAKTRRDASRRRAAEYCW